MREMSLAVVGVGFDNKKGPPRQFEIAMCTPGEPVKLVPEPRNPADPNAIAVYSARDIQIGYLRAERAPMIGAAMRRGVVIAIFQRKEEWGATIRANLEGRAPTLPAEQERRAAPAEGEGDGAPDWWPDEIWEDD
ncbi:HIRAN domain-containing protein [Sphingopyxis sp. 113P3]|uniref:HIRAN domain-containing protein n=1 Tax=Sphingopyxis sp. (strain 113P3) TaxID=292913 RepID=UPI0006BCFD2E|nr:HIRAN domain-containing protein [Sphingopyxis sp. 113P3]ALC12510.1 hypothetical protein LH20_11160 [Sphingopyxis sp. 113P3]